MFQMECDTSESVQKQEVGLQAPAEKRMKPSDFAEYDKLVNELANLLKIVRHPDSSVTIKAAKLLIEKLSSDVIVGETNDSVTTTTGATTAKTTTQIGTEDGREEIRIQQSKFNLNDIILPDSVTRRASERVSKLSLSSATAISKADGVEASGGGSMEKDDLMEMFRRSAKALKLLYLDDQKQLQNQVNGIISSIQSITANPKTDHRLAAGGR